MGRLEGRVTSAGESELGDRLNKMYEDMEKKSKEIDQERERRKEKEEELIEMKKVIIDKTELLDKANEELVSCREIMNANQPIEVTSLKIERDKIVQEQEATKKELEIELETKEKK